MKGFAGAGGDRFGPALGSVAELIVIYRHSPDAPDDIVAIENSALQQYGQVHWFEHADDMTAGALAVVAEIGPVDGVITLSEQLLVEGAAVAEALGLPHHSSESIRLCRDKYLQRTTLRAAGVDSVRVHRIDSIDDVQPAIDHVGFPGVLKPVAGAGSAFTFQIDSADDMWESYRLATAHVDEAANLRNQVQSFIYEEFLVSEPPDERLAGYCSVESLISDGKVQHFAISDRLPLGPHFRETGLLVPTILEPYRQQPLLELAEEAIAGLGLTDGATHVEIMHTPTGPRLIEVNARLGGHVSTLWPFICGWDPVHELANIALGRPLNPVGTLNRAGAYLMISVPGDEVTVDHTYGLDEIAAMPEVRVVHRDFADGDHVSALKGTRSGVAKVFATAPDTDQLIDVDAEIRRTLRFEVTDDTATGANE